MTCILVKVSDLLSTDSTQLPIHVMVKYFSPCSDMGQDAAYQFACADNKWMLVQECYGVA